VGENDDEEHGRERRNDDPPARHAHQEQDGQAEGRQDGEERNSGVGVSAALRADVDSMSKPSRDDGRGDRAEKIGEDHHEDDCHGLLRDCAGFPGELDEKLAFRALLGPRRKSVEESFPVKLVQAIPLGSFTSLLLALILYRNRWKKKGIRGTRRKNRW